MGNMRKKKICCAVSVFAVSGMLSIMPAVRSEAAVITSNATDKIAVIFDAAAEYSAGDYVMYDGELYLCTQDVQGDWDAAESSFMQITKNHEIGKSEELSASYSPSKDPSDEKSLAAFIANAWQKLKLFFGTDDRGSETDRSGFKNASVSAKLNYLEKQNSTLDQNLGNLRESVDRSFQSVSNGKSKLSDAITDKGGTASPQDSFDQLSRAVTALALAQFDKGKTQGKEEGIAEGKELGRKEADERVNTDSASYRQGVADSGLKTYSVKMKVDYDGPKSENDCWSYQQGISENHRSWKFAKSFAGHKIAAVRTKQTSSSPYGGASGTQMALLINGEYQMLSDDNEYHGNGSDIKVSQDTFVWDGFSFNVLYKNDSWSELDIVIYYQ